MKKSIFALLFFALLIGCKDNNKNNGGGGGGGTGGAVPIGQLKAWDGVKRGDVFYEIFVRSFADSDGNGIGDLNGITAKLPYLDSLGVTGLWLTPINPSPSYHGYDVLDYKEVNPQFGTMQDFDNLISAADALGIKIVLDFVINHSSSEHPWFIDAQKSIDAPTRSHYSFETKVDVKQRCESGSVDMVDDNKYNGGSWRDVVGAGKTEDYKYYGIFSYTMPDFNYGRVPNLNPIYDEIISAAKFWMDRGAAGLRLDAVKHIYQNERGAENVKFLKRFYDDLKAAYPDIYMVGEVLAGMDDTAPFFGALPSLFHFDSWWKLKYALTSGVGKWYAKDMSEAITKFSAVNPNFNACTKLSNHDEDRAMSDFGGSEARAKIAIAAIMTMPGQPYIYYGEEIGMTGTKANGDQGVREPLPWGDSYTTSWCSITAAPKTIKEQCADKNSLWSFYQKMIKVRNIYPALASGNLTFKEPSSLPDNLLLYTRQGGGEKITIAINPTDKALSWMGAPAGTPILSHNGANLIKGDGFYSLQLPAYSIIIIVI